MDIIISSRVKRPVAPAVVRGQVRTDVDKDLIVLITDYDDKLLFTYLDNKVVPNLIGKSFEVSEWDNFRWQFPIVADHSSLMITIK